MTDLLSRLKNYKLIPPIPESLYEWRNESFKCDTFGNLGKAYLDIPRQSLKVRHDSDAVITHLHTNEIPLTRFMQLYDNMIIGNGETAEENDKKLDEFL